MPERLSTLKVHESKHLGGAPNCLRFGAIWVARCKSRDILGDMTHTDTIPQVDAPQQHEPGSFLTIEEIRAANATSGYYFFSPESCRFFGSRIGRRVYPGAIFVTSERSGFESDSPRAWSVRRALAGGAIETLGGFNRFVSRAGAHAAARRASAHWVATGELPADLTPEH